MCEFRPLIAGSALLRVAGCPIRLWTQAGNPQVFQKLRQLNVLQEHYDDLGKGLADCLGRSLVPQTSLSREERAFVLTVRRHLFHGTPLRERDCQQLMALADRCLGSSSPLLKELEHARICSRNIRARECEASRDITQEQERVLQLPWEFVCATPIARALLQRMNPLVYREVEAQVRRRGQMNNRKRRQSSDYLW